MYLCQMLEILLVREFSKQSFRPKLLLSTLLKRFSLQFLLLPAGQKSEDSDLSACKATKPTIVQSINYVVLEHLLRARKACHCPVPPPHPPVLILVGSREEQYKECYQRANKECAPGHNLKNKNKIQRNKNQHRTQDRFHETELLENIIKESCLCVFKQ